MITFLALSPSLDVTLLVRSLRVGGISRPYSSHTVAGGKAVNAARVAARLEAEVRLVATLGGPIGGRVAALVSATAPSLDLYIIPIEHETRMCISIAADDADGLTELYEPVADMADWSDVSDAIDSVGAAEWLVLSGSIPGGLDLTALAAKLATAVDRGVLVAVDTHGPALAELLLIRPALVKINRAEAAEIVSMVGFESDGIGGTAAAGIPTAHDLVVTLGHRTGGIVVITDGAAGSVAGSPAMEHPLVVSPDTKVGRYPVGSGDSFLGALVAALDEEAPLLEAIARGAAAGSANAGVPGAAEFSVADYDLALQRVVIDLVGVR